MRQNSFVVYQSPADQASGSATILTRRELEKLDECETEHEVVSFITPILETVFLDHPSGLVVVNSEEYKWLETVENLPQFSEKPDLFLCHPVFYNEKPPFKTKDSRLLSLRREEDRYGTLAKWRLRDSIALTFEAKKKIDNQGFGEVINYGAHICKDDGPDRTRLVLFDKTCFWLVESIRGYVSSVTTCNWDQPGSKTILSDFVMSEPWTDVLQKALAHFGLCAGPGSFLGAGAFGRVFRVQNRLTGKELALKVVLDNNDRAEKEFTAEKYIMQEANRKCPDIVMGVEGFKWFHGDGGAILLCDVGECVTQLRSAWEVIKESLKELHNNNILHGDARVENVLAVKGKPCWIDFRDAKLFANDAGKRWDMETLGESIEAHRK